MVKFVIVCVKIYAVNRDSVPGNSYYILDISLLVLVLLLFLLLSLFAVVVNMLLLPIKLRDENDCIIWPSEQLLCLQEMLKHFRLKELKDVLSKLGLPRHGKKQVCSLLFCISTFYTNKF